MFTQTAQTSGRSFARAFQKRVLGSDLVDLLTGPHGVDRYTELVAPTWTLGEARAKVHADIATGRIDLYLAPIGESFGPPLPVRVIGNGDGVDVLFTLARFPGQSDDEWQEGLASMARELQNLKDRYEG